MIFRSQLIIVLILCFLSSPLFSKTIVVSIQGDDQAQGTLEQPFRSISQAAKIAMPGDTILVQPGIYRERVAPPRGGLPDKPITYRGVTLGKVFIRGSEIWSPKWEVHQDSVYYADLKSDLFKSDDVYLDSANPFLVELASTPYTRDGKREFERYQTGDPNLVYTCGQIIVGGRPWSQRPYLKEVLKYDKTWTFIKDKSKGGSYCGRVYVNFGSLNPNKLSIEITTRRRNFAPHVQGLGHIVVEGFVMEHCGNQYPTNFWNTPKWGQAGALGLRKGHHWIVRKNVIRYANTFAIDFGDFGGDNQRVTSSIPGAPYSHDNLIENNYILENGSAGIMGAGSTRVIIRGNVIMRNNTLRFIGKKRYEHGGIKAHNIRDGLIERNYVADSPLSEGIWLDNKFPETRVTRNFVYRNGARGIFVEMSDYKYDRAYIDNNISLENKGAQFYVHDASGSTVLNNLFANSPKESKYGQGAYIYQVNARTKTGYHSLFNNIFVNHKVMMDINYPSHRSGPQRLDFNIYDAEKTDRTFLINAYSDRPTPWKGEDFFKMVKKEIGFGNPQSLNGGIKVALTMKEWRQFWQKHQLKNDANSVLKKGIKVSYDQRQLTLIVDLPFEPSGVGSQPYKILDFDYYSQPIPSNGSATPGPFQKLKKGRNVFRVWDGLPLLAEGELPKA